MSLTRRLNTTRHSGHPLGSDAKPDGTRPETPCWTWPGKRNKSGYGIMEFESGSASLAHRMIFTTSGHQIPRGHHLHHLCRNRACINPDHLVALSPDDHAEIHPHMKRAAGRPGDHLPAGSSGLHIDPYTTTVTQQVAEAHALAALLMQDGPSDARHSSFWEYVSPQDFTSPEARTLAYSICTGECLSGSFTDAGFMARDLRQQASLFPTDFDWVAEAKGAMAWLGIRTLTARLNCASPDEVPALRRAIASLRAVK